jgi:hypothetical protein
METHVLWGLLFAATAPLTLGAAAAALLLAMTRGLRRGLREWLGLE